MRSARRSPSGEKTRGRTETTFDVGPLRVDPDRVRQRKVFSMQVEAHAGTVEAVGDDAPVVVPSVPEEGDPAARRAAR